MLLEVLKNSPQKKIKKKKKLTSFTLSTSSYNKLFKILKQLI